MLTSIFMLFLPFKINSNTLHLVVFYRDRKMASFPPTTRRHPLSF